VKPAHIDKPMFRTTFVGDANDTRRLLGYLQSLQAESSADMLARHELGPSDLWKAWSDDTFIGFSGDRILVMSGHRFGWSELLPPPVRWPWQRKTGFSIERENAAFARCYPDFAIPSVHVQLREYHPGAYLRSAEAYILSGAPKAGRMLEVGAGNCVHVAFRHLLDPTMRTTVIDLPASIPVGFLLLRLVGIDAALPNEASDAPVRFRLPHQPVEGRFDFAFNMSSFQEMTMSTVNGYMALIAGRLRPGGALQHVNMRAARYIPDNRIAAYDMSAFTSPQETDAAYHSGVAGFPVASVVARTLEEEAARVRA
jgi:hypothetical protein